MTKRRINALKRAATKHLIIGIVMAIVGTIPVVFQWGTDATGSVFCWLLATIVMFDSIKKLYILNIKY